MNEPLFPFGGVLRARVAACASALRWLLVAVAVAATAASGAARAGEIVDAAYVADALGRGAIVWDVRDAAGYAEGHIPGAVNVGEIGAVLRDPNREDWVPTSQVEAILGRAGIDLVGREVIVYARTGDPNAYYALNGIRHFGGRAGRVFHGGIDAWQAAGRPVTKEPTTLAPVALKLAPVPGTLIGNAEMLERLKSGAPQLVDARTPKEFSGDDVRAIRGGHIPGAVNLPFEQNWVDPDTGVKLAARQVRTREGMSLKPDAELRKLYAALDRDREVVVYCQSGVRAAVTAAVLRDIGFKDVKVYEPSWLGYAGMLAAPAEREVFLNVGALNGRIGALTGRIGELEAEIARLKAGR
jgi:thiosulfate/3-mercaptopyruvate sulfurtransferase